MTRFLRTVVATKRVEVIEHLAGIRVSWEWDYDDAWIMSVGVMPEDPTDGPVFVFPQETTP